MSRDKYDFIEDLINNEKIAEEQKERLLRLTMLEIRVDRDLGKGIEERVEKLEELIRTKIQSINANKTEPDYNTPVGMANQRKAERDGNYPNYQDPAFLYKFLFDFHADPVLKYLCHKIDDIDWLKDRSPYNFKKHLEEIKRAYNIIQKKYESKIEKINTFALIYRYIYGGGPWSSYGIKMSWSSPSLLEWSEKPENHGRVPNPGDNFIEEFEKSMLNKLCQI